MKLTAKLFETFQKQAFPLKEYLSKNTLAPDSVDILRLDQLHETVSGNKWFKLKYNIDMAIKEGYSEEVYSEEGHSGILTCGGVHSNHLHAIACAGQYFNIPVRAFVRGYSNLPLTPTLVDCEKMGMQIEFIDKKTYLKRYDPIWCQQQAQQSNSYWIPEGGNNDLGQKGCEDIVNGCLDNGSFNYDEVWLSIGSGCTFQGIERALPDTTILKGIMAIKSGQELGESLVANARIPSRCEIDYESHWGGFGKCPQDLIEFIQQHDRWGLPLDPIYTSKLMFSFEKEWAEGRLDPDKKYLIVHSGGLQGRRGIKGLSI